jgi:hypothetical protein
MTPQHTHAPLAQALSAGIKAARVNDKFQEPLYLALELCRAGVLHGDLWSGRAWSGGPSFGTGMYRSPSFRSPREPVQVGDEPGLMA